MGFGRDLTGNGKLDYTLYERGHGAEEASWKAPPNKGFPCGDSFSSLCKRLGGDLQADNSMGALTYGTGASPEFTHSARASWLPK
mmetsp:Transcript_43451/g.98851  ORF Transcript_43451/g.98851 Transcript_43451/m.98851 type:complete len:85 (+) Transcript_43451:30-284(+)